MRRSEGLRGDTIAKHRAIRRDGKDGMSLSRTLFGSQFIAFCDMLRLHGFFQFNSRPLLHGKVGPCLHPFWVRALTGCPQAPGDPWDPLVISTLPPAHPSPGASSGLSPSRGPAGASSLSAFAFKKGLIIHPSPPTPRDALKGSIQHQTQHPYSFPIPWFPA